MKDPIDIQYKLKYQNAKGAIKDYSISAPFDSMRKDGEKIGFVALKGHFLNKNLVDKLYTEVNSFFNLPIETKIKYEIKGLNGQRGYTSFGKEHAKGRSVGDLKEFWHFGQEIKNENILNRKYPANLEVNEIPMFNKVGITSYKMIEKTGKEILRALSIYLNLDEFYFDKYIFNGNSIVRAIHYPPIKNKASVSPCLPAA